MKYLGNNVRKKALKQLENVRFDKMSNQSILVCASSFVSLLDGEFYVNEYCHFMKYKDQFIIVPDSIYRYFIDLGAEDLSSKIYLLMGE